MSTKERLHQIIDEMNEDQAAVLLTDPDGPRPPLTDEEREGVAGARGERRAGKGIPLEEAIRWLRAGCDSS